MTKLVLEVPAGELAAVLEALPKLMDGVAKLSVPLLVDVGVGNNWDEAHWGRVWAVTARALRAFIRPPGGRRMLGEPPLQASRASSWT